MFVQGEDMQEDTEDDEITNKVKHTKALQVLMEIAHRKILKFANCAGSNSETVQDRAKEYFCKIMTGFNLRKFENSQHGNPCLTKLVAFWASVHLDQLFSMPKAHKTPAKGKSKAKGSASKDLGKSGKTKSK